MIESFWRRTQDEGLHGPGWSFVRGALWGLVPLFHGASLAKRALFGSCPVFRTRLPALTVSIGNLTMGGSGKTTMTRLVAELLADDLGLRTAVLSRGYRSTNRAAVLPISRDGVVAGGPEQCGDKAWLLAHWLQSSSVVVGKRRAVSGRWAVEHLGARAVVLDDGLQYWRLERDVDIVMVAAPTGFGNGLPFPRGPLREPLWGLRRASCIVLFQQSDGDTDSLRRLQRFIAAEAPTIPIIGVDLQARRGRAAVAVRAGTIPPSEGTIELGGKRVHAFCGLGSPESFRRTLIGLGVVVVGCSVFPDHHVYSAADIAGVRRAAVAAEAEVIVTTEKDEANLTTVGEDGPPMVVVPVEGVFCGDGRQQLIDIVKRKMA